jgi:hypothetical protein
VRVKPTEKLFLTANPQKNSFYFCVLFSNGTPSEKYFSMGIHIFLWVFAQTENSRVRGHIAHLRLLMAGPIALWEKAGQ